MESNEDNEIIVGLDIGSSKIDVVIAELIPKENEDENWDVRVVGVGTQPSEGLRAGVIVNIDAAVKSIQKTIEVAELMSGRDVKEVYVGISGQHIKSMSGHGVVTVTSKDNEITTVDVDKAIEQASTINLPSDQVIIHVLPQGFTVDDQKGINDPVGMNGVRLEVDVHIIIAKNSVLQNIYKAVERAGIKVADIVLSSWASSFAVLSADEKELGVAILDIGSGTTDLAEFSKDAIRYIHCSEISGNYVTNDVARGLSTPTERAEELKKRNGACKLSSLQQDEYVTVPGIGGRPDHQVEKAELINIIRARMKEIFEIIDKDIKKNKVKERLGAGIVLTGGSVILEGTVELAEEVFDLPVKIGVPTNNSGIAECINSPDHATGVGLVVYAARQMQHEGVSSSFTKSSLNPSKIFKTILQFIKDYI